MKPANEKTLLSAATYIGIGVVVIGLIYLAWRFL